MERRIALLLTNPNSRNGDTDLNDLIAYLESGNIQVIHRLPESPGQIGETIREHSDEVDLVVIGGGDGTLNCAARALIDTGLPLGILPLGTANDLARSLQIPEDLHQALEIITNGRTKKIDVGSVNDILFFNASSIGLGVKVTRKLTGDAKSRWGVLSYAHSVWNALKTNRSFVADVECDGKKSRIRSIQITVGNGRYYGGGMAIAEDARIDDQRLDFYSLRPQSLWHLLFVAPLVRMGRFRDVDQTEVMSGQKIDIYTPQKERTVTTDGEITSSTPAHYRLLPNAIRVHVP